MELLKNHYQFLIFLFLSIFLVSFVYAQPPQTNVNIDNGIEISYSKFKQVKINQAFNLTIHTYNISNGLRISGADCELNIFLHNGSKVFDESFVTGVNDYYKFLSAGNFSVSDLYSFNIYCNKSEIGGFADGLFEVTESGSILKEGEGFVLFGIILILILVTILFLVATIFIENPPFKVFLGSLAVLILIATLGFGVTIMQQLFGTFTNIVSSYTLFFRLFMVLLGGAGISLVFFLVVFAMKLFSQSKGRID